MIVTIKFTLWGTRQQPSFWQELNTAENQRCYKKLVNDFQTMRQTSGLSKEVKMMIGIQNMSSDKLDTTKGQHQTTDLNGFQKKGCYAKKIHI